MRRLLELQAELAKFESQQLRTVTADQKRQILQLARDFPRLWTASTTAARDRKRILRLLIRDITVLKSPEPKLLWLQIRWQGGATETIELRRRPNRAEAVRYPEAFVAKIRTLAERYDDKEIVARLNGEGLTSSTGKPFTVSMIRWLRYKHRIPAPSIPAGTLAVSQVRARYGVSLWVVHYWIERGIVAAAQRKRNAPYAITIDDNVDCGRSPPPGFGYCPPPHRVRPVCLRDQFLAQAGQPLLQARRFDRRKGHSIHTRCSGIESGQRIGVPQNVLAVNLVVEQVEAEARLCLRLTVQLSLKGPGRDRCRKAHRQSPSPRHLRKHTRSQGPSLRRHYPASTVV